MTCAAYRKVFKDRIGMPSEFGSGFMENMGSIGSLLIILFFPCSPHSLCTGLVQMLSAQVYTTL